MLAPHTETSTIYKSRRAATLKKKTRPKLDIERFDLTKLVVSAIESGASVEEAANAVALEILSNKSRTRLVVEWACRNAARIAVSALRSDIAFIEGVDPLKLAMEKPQSRPHYLNALTTMMTIYDWKLPVTRISLGDAKADDLASAQQFYADRAVSFAARSEAFKRLHERLVQTRKKTVRQAFTAEQVKDILGDVD